MGRKVRQWSAIIAAAIVLGCVGTFSIEPVSNFAPWPAPGMSWVWVTAAICGYLLAFNVTRSNWAMVAASALSTLILGGIWAYVIWQLLGPLRQQVSLLDFLVSDLVFHLGIRRGAVLFVFSVPFGLLGVKVKSLLLPDDRWHQGEAAH